MEIRELFSIILAGFHLIWTIHLISHHAFHSAQLASTASTIVLMMSGKVNAAFWLIALIAGLHRFHCSPASSMQRRLSDSGDKRSVPSASRRGVDILDYRVTKDLEMGRINRSNGYFVPTDRSNSSQSSRSSSRKQDLTSKISRDTLQAALVAIQTANEITKTSSVNIGFHGSVIDQLAEEGARQERERRLREVTEAVSGLIIRGCIIHENDETLTVVLPDVHSYISAWVCSVCCQ